MKRAFFSGLMLSLLFTAPAFAKPAPVEGLWLNEEGDGAIEIRLGKDGKLYGVGAAVPGSKAKDRLDVNNPDPKLRSRSLSGAKILWGFEADNAERTEWVDGSIYDPGNGKTYSCKMELDGGKLKIRGYVGISLFGRTAVWTRAPQR